MEKREPIPMTREAAIKILTEADIPIRQPFNHIHNNGNY